MINEKKLLRYNQILMALIGTIVVGVGLYFLAGQAVSWVQSLLKEDKQVIIVPKPTQPDEPKFRYSKIKMNAPVLVDKGQRLFIIPFSQNKLKNPVLLESSKLYAPTYYRHHYNNLVLYDNMRQTSHVLVKKRSYIHQFAYKKTSTNRYVLYLAAQEDTNKNGLLDDGDAKDLYWYDIETGKTNRSNLGTLMSFDLRVRQDETVGLYPHQVLIQVRLDAEISDYRLLNLKTGQIRDFVSKETVKRIQQILDLGERK